MDNLQSLFHSLGTNVTPPPAAVITVDKIHEPFRSLLVHDRHMTVAMEEFHRCKVAVKVLRKNREGASYTRQILLFPHGMESDFPGNVIQGGLVRIHLAMLDELIVKAIIREDTPLGHLLIGHEVLRRIEVKSYLKLMPGPELASWPGFPEDKPSYGRLAHIYCDGQPAIELFELIPDKSPPYQG